MPAKPKPEAPAKKQRAEVTADIQKALTSAAKKGRDDGADAMLTAYLDGGLSYTQIGEVVGKAPQWVRAAMISRTKRLPEGERRLTWEVRPRTDKPAAQEPRPKAEPAERDAPEVEPVEDAPLAVIDLPRADARPI